MPHDECKRAEMRSMGFTDDAMIDHALTRAGGDVESAVEMLFEGRIPPNGGTAFEPDGKGSVVRRSILRKHTPTSPTPSTLIFGPERPARVSRPAQLDSSLVQALLDSPCLCTKALLALHPGRASGCDGPH